MEREKYLLDVNNIRNTQIHSVGEKSKDFSTKSGGKYRSHLNFKGLMSVGLLTYLLHGAEYFLRS